MLSQDRHYLAAVANFLEQPYSGDLQQLQAIHDGGPFTEAPENEAVAVGTGLGDLLAGELGMTWVRVTDELGVDLALRYPETQVLLFPRSMLLKRMGERVELEPFFARLCAEVRRLV